MPIQDLITNRAELDLKKTANAAADSVKAVRDTLDQMKNLISAKYGNKALDNVEKPASKLTLRNFLHVSRILDKDDEGMLGKALRAREDRNRYVNARLQEHFQGQSSPELIKALREEYKALQGAKALQARTESNKALMQAVGFTPSAAAALEDVKAAAEPSKPGNPADQLETIRSNDEVTGTLEDIEKNTEKINTSIDKLSTELKKLIKQGALELAEGGAGSPLSNLGRDAVDAGASSGLFGKLTRGASKFVKSGAGRLFGGIAAAGLGAYEGISGWNAADKAESSSGADIEADLKSGKISPEEAAAQKKIVEDKSHVAKGGAAGKGVGTAAGAWIGGVLGALVPIPGVDVATAALGSAAGAYVGGKTGQFIGEGAGGVLNSISDWMHGASSSDTPYTPQEESAVAQADPKLFNQYIQFKTSDMNTLAKAHAANHNRQSPNAEDIKAASDAAGRDARKKYGTQMDPIIRKSGASSGSPSTTPINAIEPANAPSVPANVVSETGAAANVSNTTNGGDVNVNAPTINNTTRNTTPPIQWGASNRERTAFDWAASLW